MKRRVSLVLVAGAMAVGVTGCPPPPEPLPDTIPPVVSIAGAVVVPATGSDGALASLVVTATDNIGVKVGPLCSRSTGGGGYFSPEQPQQYPIGRTDLVCAAQDAAGNTSAIAQTSVTVTTTASAIAASADGGTLCAITAFGNVDCWGPGGQPALVRGSRQVVGATSIAVGSGFACALIAGGRVECWGSNNQFGQLGAGVPTSTTDPGVPQLLQAEVPDITNAVALASGRSHTCALLSDGRVSCWGSNSYGQVGAGVPPYYTGENPTPMPVIVAGVDNAVSIVAAQSHTCALLAGGTVTCWGADKYTEGFGATTVATSPTTVAGISGATALSSGGNEVCAVTAGGAVTCWSRGSLFNVGLQSVQGMIGATALTGGYSGIGCALQSGGTVGCWRAVFTFPLVGPLLAASTLPGVTDATAIASGGGNGGSFVYVLTADGSVEFLLQYWSDPALGVAEPLGWLRS